MKKDTRLDARQIRILEDYFGRSVAGETMEQIAKDNGISRKTLSQWKNTEHGKKLHETFQKEMSANDLPKFYAKLSEQMQKGSFKHMELYAKIHGLLAPEKKEIVTEDKRPVSDTVISKEFLEDLNRRLGKDKEQEKKEAEAEEKRKERIKELEEQSNIIRFGR